MCSTLYFKDIVVFYFKDIDVFSVFSAPLQQSGIHPQELLHNSVTWPAQILLCPFYSFYLLNFLLYTLYFIQTCIVYLQQFFSFAISTMFCTILQGGKFIGEAFCEL